MLTRSKSSPLTTASPLSRLLGDWVLPWLGLAVLLLAWLRLGSPRPDRHRATAGIAQPTVLRRGGRAVTSLARPSVVGFLSIVGFVGAFVLFYNPLGTPELPLSADVERLRQQPVPSKGQPVAGPVAVQSFLQAFRSLDRHVAALPVPIMEEPPNMEAHQVAPPGSQEHVQVVPGEAAVVVDESEPAFEALVEERPPLPFLPAWVEPTRQTPLWTAWGEAAAPHSLISSGASLRVLDARGSRLHVQHSTGRGWVEVRDVTPSNAPQSWLQTNGNVHLQLEPVSAGILQVLPHASFLQVDGENQAEGWAAVKAFAEDGTPLGGGRVELSGLQSAQSPDWARKAIWSDAAVNVQKLAGESREAFIERIGTAAARVSRESRVPASVTVGQAILESDWGQSKLSADYNNLFGIKAHRGIGSAGVVWMPTTEVFNGVAVRVLDSFRAYHSAQDSIRDHGEFLKAPHYAAAFEVTHDPREFLRRIWEGGYATDPAYVSKVWSIIERYNLTRFDQP